jgi:hypothetical protein
MRNADKGCSSGMGVGIGAVTKSALMWSEMLYPNTFWECPGSTVRAAADTTIVEPAPAHVGNGLGLFLREANGDPGQVDTSPGCRLQ